MNKDIEYHENSEGNWTEVKRKRQRNSPEIMTRNLKQTKLNNYWLNQPVSTSNSFASLEDEVQQETNTDLKEKTTKPPPIFIDKVSNMQPLIKLFNYHANGNYEAKVLRNEQVKILLKTFEVYTTIVKQLELKNTEFYTYKPKQERNFKVVLKNMHPSTDTNEIKKALDELGHTVTNIWNIKQRRTKRALPMFIVKLQSKANNKHIYEIKSLLHCRIIFEPPRPRRDIPQCANCQQYGQKRIVDENLNALNALEITPQLSVQERTDLKT
ncbi:nucleic-acid-binding protein from transposon x-element [Lasius niger]|uniref:Nucleic-acid-binding protein from transposon x-element n=1 Tax=Lasius niger TaxID=67767 RepID=A0A0J7KIB1_LASNI|nr:nucleic-acid-binding protein from transposon x-element [Lasius niger]